MHQPLWERYDTMDSCLSSSPPPPPWLSEQRKRFKIRHWIERFEILFMNWIESTWKGQLVPKKIVEGIKYGYRIRVHARSSQSPRLPPLPLSVVASASSGEAGDATAHSPLPPSRAGRIDPHSPPPGSHAHHPHAGRNNAADDRAASSSILY